MSIIKETVWFGSDAEGLKSPTVTIPAGGKVVMVGFNFSDMDTAVFEVVAIKSFKPDMNDCCMPQVRLPEVYATAPLNEPCQPCTRVVMDKCRNMIVVDNPAGFSLRAERSSVSAAEIHVKVINGETK